MTKNEVMLQFGLPSLGDSEWVSLHCTTGNSDKVYIMAICGDELMTGYGRRGNGLNVSTKNCSGYATAMMLMDATTRDKQRKGYVDVGKQPSPVAATASTSGGTRPSDLMVCLPTATNSIEDAYGMGRRMINTTAKRCVQEKMDGMRVVVQASSTEVDAFSRSGREITLSDVLQVGFKVLSKDLSHRMSTDGDTKWCFDTELVDDVHHVFECFSLQTMPRLLPDPTARMELFEQALASMAALRLSSSVIAAVPSKRYTLSEAKAFADGIYERSGEGVVIRAVDQFPIDGRAANVMKVKFTETADVVLQSNDTAKRSMRMTVVDTEGDVVQVGNVTIPPNITWPKEGAIAEVRYLYRTPGPGGALQQPVFVRERDYLDATDCTEAKIIRIKTPWVSVPPPLATRVNVAVCVNW